MPFFHYSQNNSGGHFYGPARHVVVEADNAQEANDRAQEHDVYFDGVHAGVDCRCCGDRWHPSGYEEEGTEEPSVYGDSVLDYLGSKYNRSRANMPSVAVFYADGSEKVYP